MQLNTENKRAVIYCRVSTKEQVEEGNSLVTQEKICKEYAIKNGYEIVEVFIEQGESAKTAERTELQKLLAYCASKKNNVNVVIAYKIDRISRNTDDYSQIRLLLKRYGVEIKSTSEYFENTPAGRFMENIIANVAQFDNDVRTERSIGGMRDATREGRYVWLAPIGYKNTKIGGKANIIKSEMAPIVKNAFELVATNMHAIDEVWRMSSEIGLLSNNGKPFSRSYFYKMLKNELYAGWIIKFKERHKGIFEPIISEPLFAQVQQVLAGKKRIISCYNHYNPDFPLRRFVAHPSCGSVTGGWSKGRKRKYAYYRFKQKGLEFRKEFFEEAFVEFMNQHALDNTHYSKLRNKLSRNLQKKTDESLKKATILGSYINSIKERQKLLIEKNLKGVISDSVLRDQLDLLEHELIKSQYSLSQESENHYDFNKLLDSVSKFLKHPGKTWKNASYEQRIRLQRFKFPKGVLFENEKFRTAELCRIFKTKELFQDSLSLVVHHRISTLNTLDTVNTNKELFWKQVGEELIELNEILYPIVSLHDEFENVLFPIKKL